MSRFLAVAALTFFLNLQTSYGFFDGSGTPKQAIEQIIKAVETRDVDLFEKHVALDQIINRALDDATKGYEPDSIIASGVKHLFGWKTQTELELMRPMLIDRFTREVARGVESGSISSLDDIAPSIAGKSVVVAGGLITIHPERADIETKGKVSVAKIPATNALNPDIPITLHFILREIGGHWKVVEAENLYVALGSFEEESMRRIRSAQAKEEMKNQEKLKSQEEEIKAKNSESIRNRDYLSEKFDNAFRVELTSSEVSESGADLIFKFEAVDENISEWNFRLTGVMKLADKRGRIIYSKFDTEFVHSFDPFLPKGSSATISRHFSNADLNSEAIELSGSSDSVELLLGVAPRIKTSSIVTETGLVLISAGRLNAETAKGYGRSSQSAADADPSPEIAYYNALQSQIRSKLILPPGLRGDPQATFKVTQRSNGDVSKVELLKSSDNPQLDMAIERAIQRASPLQLPSDQTLFKQELILTFRPLKSP